MNPLQKHLLVHKTILNSSRSQFAKYIILTFSVGEKVLGGRWQDQQESSLDLRQRNVWNWKEQDVQQDHYLQNHLLSSVN